MTYPPASPELLDIASRTLADFREAAGDESVDALELIEATQIRSERGHLEVCGAICAVLDAEDAARKARRNA